MAYIILREPGQAPIPIPLHDGFRAGRHVENDLQLRDHQASRQHVQFSLAAERWSITDLGSTQGTLVNGARIDTHVLQDNDRIQVGNVLLTFVAEGDPHEIVHQQVTENRPPAQGDGADRRLRLVYDLSRAVGALEDADELLGRMLAAILEVLGCERAMAGLIGDEEDGGLRRVVRVRGSLREDVVVSRAMIEAMTVRRQGIILRNAGDREVPQTLVREGILSAMGVPLQAGSRLFGFLYVDDRSHFDRFSPQDLDFLTSLGHLTAAALESANRFHRVAALAEALVANNPTDELIGASAPMRQLRAQIQRYGASAGTNILIRGESGTGKELVARALHAVSPRAEQPFVAINCAAIPDAMIESELFGYVRGAFTGANRDRRGRFALADRGTLFLDEIGDLPLGAQATVLRAIEEGEIQPLGSERTLHVNVRIIAATHRDLLTEIAEKRFREDLYYRLNVVEIETPPLRSHDEDIGLLAQTLLCSLAASMGKRIQGLTEAALGALRRHPWPGNVRELRNEMERAAINTESAIVDISDLSPKLRSAVKGPPPSEPTATLAERFNQLEPMERQLIEEALHAARGNLAEAARLLGITRVMMKRRVERFGLGARDD